MVAVILASLLVAALGAAQATGRVSPTSDVSSNRAKATGAAASRTMADHLRTLPDAQIDAAHIVTGAFPDGVNASSVTVTATDSVTARVLKDIAADVSASVRTPLVDSDAGTFLHVIWRDGAIVDLTGKAFTKVGSPTQVAATRTAPAGASGFTGAANRYDLTDPTVIASTTWDLFIGVAVVKPTAGDLAATTMVATFATNNGGAQLYQLVANETGLIRWFSGGTCTDSPLIANQVNVICFANDRSIGRSWLKVNMRPLVTGIGAQVVDATMVKFGSHWDNLLAFAGTIYELWLSTSVSGGAGGAWYGPELIDWQCSELTRKVYQRLGYNYVTASRPVYRATVAIDAASARTQEIVANNGTAFAIAAPTVTSLPVAGQSLRIRIKNTHTSALGAVTWDPAYSLTTWTSPASGFSRTIEFESDGTKWIEVNRTPADVPN